MYVLCLVFAIQNENVVNALSVETHLQVETYQNKPHILPSSVTPLTPSVSNAFRKKSLHKGHHFLHFQTS